MDAENRKAAASKEKSWHWRKRQDIHIEAKRVCERVLTSEPGMLERQPKKFSRLYDNFILSPGRALKIRPIADGEAWWFAEWKNEAGEWYVCILAQRGHTWDSALLDLSEVLAEVELGFRKPTRVKRKTAISE